MGRTLSEEVVAAVLEAGEAVVCNNGAGHGGSGDDGDLGEVHCWFVGEEVGIVNVIEELLRLLWMCCVIVVLFREGHRPLYTLLLILGLLFILHCETLRRLRWIPS
jgi:hypothetical protein